MTLSELRIEVNFLNLIKNIYKKPTGNIILKSEKPPHAAQLKKQKQTNSPIKKKKKKMGVSSKQTFIKKKTHRWPKST